jgi:hypothetical protein
MPDVAVLGSELPVLVGVSYIRTFYYVPVRNGDDTVSYRGHSPMRKCHDIAAEFRGYATKIVNVRTTSSLRYPQTMKAQGVRVRLSSCTMFT